MLAAAAMKGQIAGEVKNARIDRLIEAGDKAASEFVELCRNSVREVLFEEFAVDGSGLITGYSDNYVKVYAEGTDADLNNLRKVRLIEEYKDGMKGEIL